MKLIILILIYSHCIFADIWSVDKSSQPTDTKIYTSETNLLSPYITLTGDTSAKSTFESGTGDFKNTGGSLGFSYPLYGWIEPDTEKGTSALQLFFVGKYGLVSPENSLLANRHTFSRGSASLVGVSYDSSKRLYLYSLGAGFSEDTIGSGTLAPIGFGGGIVGFPSGDGERPSTFYLVGGLYAYNFGKGYLLPALGLISRLNERWALSTILPLYLKVNYFLQKNLTIGGVLKVSGLQSRYSNQNEFSGSNSVLTYRQSEFRLCGEAAYKPNKIWLLKGEVGITSRRRISISEGDNELFSETTKASAYVMATISYAIGEPLLDFGI